MQNDLRYKRTPKDELSFTGEKLLRGRHKVHPYPAMLHPLLVDYLIRTYSKKGDVIFDPFCGSGVTLLQSSISGHMSYGFDINPLSLLIAKVKTDVYNIADLTEEFKDFKKAVLNSKETDTPFIKNLDYWYAPEVIRDLGIVRNILKHKEYKYKDFFVTCFAFVCRNQSYTRKSEFKRYRIKAERLDSIENNVFEKLFGHMQEMIEIFGKSEIPTEISKPILANSENIISPEIKYDLVITSPPYGDSRTTVAYGEYSSFGTEWIEGLNYYGKVDYRVDSESVGKKGEINENIKEHTLLTQILSEISNID